MAGKEGVAFGRSTLDEHSRCCWTEEEKNCHFSKHLQCWPNSAGSTALVQPLEFCQHFLTSQIVTSHINNNWRWDPSQLQPPPPWVLPKWLSIVMPICGFWIIDFSLPLLHQLQQGRQGALAWQEEKTINWMSVSRTGEVMVIIATIYLLPTMCQALCCVI